MPRKDCGVVKSADRSDNAAGAILARSCLWKPRHRIVRSRRKPDPHAFE